MKSKTWMHGAWAEEGEKLFGQDYEKWRFVCPVCSRVQSMDDFREFKNVGANPNDVYQKCLGRYTGGKTGPQKCDWAAFGLFSGPDFVINEGNKQIPVFRFASPVSGDGHARS